MRLDKSFNQSPQGGSEKIGYTSSNRPPGNYRKVLNKYLIGHVLGGQNEGSTIALIIIHLYLFILFIYLLLISKVHESRYIKFLPNSYQIASQRMPMYNPCIVRHMDLHN